MKLVIEIDDEIYKECTSVKQPFGELVNAIKHGTPIPYHCGNLIDADELLDNVHPIAYDAIRNAPIIIEADR